MRYGRPEKKLRTEPYGPWQVLALGSAMLVGFFLLTLWQADTLDTTADPVDAVAVMAIQDVVQRPEETATVAEPFGYYEGQWNFWEYLGDLFISFLA